VAFNRRCDSLLPGLGQGFRQDSLLLQTGLAMSGTAPQSFPIPSSGTLALTFTAGRVRIKIYNGGGTSPTLVDFFVTAGDGTNTIVIGQSLVHPNAAIAISATQWFEFEFEFILDVATSGAGGGASGQLSSAIGGANQMAVKTTMGGTSPTASLDVELVPLI
jgi:hypothetical protein